MNERMRDTGGADDERMRGVGGMDDAFRSRMRQGLSTMAVRERVRERARNRAIAGGALATAVVATVAVLGVQALGGIDGRHDQAAPGVTPTQMTAPAPTTPAAEPSPSEPAPTETAAPEPTAPPGFEGVAAGEPHVLDFRDCGAGGCGDAGAAGGATIEGEYDVYVLCEGSGQVQYGSGVWIDCAQANPGTGWALLGYRDVVGDGDPEFTASADFDGRLDVLPHGESPSGDAGAETATVYYDCGVGAGPTVGGIAFDCDRDVSIIPDLGAWGVPLAPGSYAPTMQVEDIGLGPTQVRWELER